MSNLLLALAVAGIVLGVSAVMRTRLGESIGRFFPTPFWIYFFAIILGITGVFPASSPVFSWLGLYGLLSALFLLLIGMPVSQLAHMGGRAAAAMGIATGTMMIACVLSFAALMHWLPAEAWKSVGALAGTWIGGSANMIAVKEVLQLSDTDLAPLIIVDTVLSYTWMAILLMLAGWQSRFDRGADAGKFFAGETFDTSSSNKVARVIPVVIAVLVSYAVAKAGKSIAASHPLLSATGWSVLVMSIVTVVLAMTPARKLERYRASQAGMMCLYAVLISIAAKTRMESVSAAPIYIVLGIVILVVHGVLLLTLGRLFRLPLFLLSIASQANVGGMASAPVVAAAYRPGAAAIGVLMAIAGTLAGTYLGVATGALCKWVLAW